jgi:chromate transporter
MLEFLKTGLFAVGGGYATLPYLYEMAENYDWFSLRELTNFIAISEVTPGPVGINMATFAGYLTGGIGGGILASLAVVTIPATLCLLLSRFIPNPTENKFMAKLFYGLIPCVLALILAASLRLFQNALLHFDTAFTAAMGWFLFAALLFAAFRFKLNPFILLLIGGVFGFLLL